MFDREMIQEIFAPCGRKGKKGGENGKGRLLFRKLQ
jgi:hypothetical protein